LTRRFRRGVYFFSPLRGFSIRRNFSYNKLFLLSELSRFSIPRGLCSPFPPPHGTDTNRLFSRQLPAPIDHPKSKIGLGQKLTPLPPPPSLISPQREDPRLSRTEPSRGLHSPGTPRFCPRPFAYPQRTLIIRGMPPSPLPILQSACCDFSGPISAGFLFLPFSSS